MNINIAVLACLQLIAVHKEFPVKLLVQFIEYQASLGCNQRTVCVCIALVPDIADRLALGIDLVHHVDKIMLIISVIPVTLGNRRVYLLQSPLHNIVHFLDRNFFLPQGLRLVCGISAQEVNLLLRKAVHDPFRGFIDCPDYFLNVKFFFCSIFLNYINHCLHLIAALHLVSLIILFFCYYQILYHKVYHVSF